MQYTDLCVLGVVIFCFGGVFFLYLKIKNKALVKTMDSYLDNTIIYSILKTFKYDKSNMIKCYYFYNSNKKDNHQCTL